MSPTDHTSEMIHGITHSIPEGQPFSVHELTQALYSTYQLDGGTVRLVGCSIEDIPIIRLKSNTFSNADPTYRYFGISGGQVEHELIEKLGIDLVEVIDNPPTVFLQREFRQTINATIDHLVHDANHNQDDGNVFEPVLVWCKRASGKLEFCCEDSTVEIKFDNWIKNLVNDPDCHPMYRCPLTGRESQHLVADDECTITVKGAIKNCDISGKHLVETKLSTCSVTNKLVDRKLLYRCPISGAWLLPTETMDCVVCGLIVSPKALKNQQCGCMATSKLTADVDLIDRFHREHSALFEEWQRWGVFSHGGCLIFRASRTFDLLFLRINPDDFSIKRKLTRKRWSHQWRQLPTENSLFLDK